MEVIYVAEDHLSWFMRLIYFLRISSPSPTLLIYFFQFFINKITTRALKCETILMINKKIILRDFYEPAKRLPCASTAIKEQPACALLILLMMMYWYTRRGSFTFCVCVVIFCCVSLQHRLLVFEERYDPYMFLMSNLDRSWLQQTTTEWKQFSYLTLSSE